MAAAETAELQPVGKNFDLSPRARFPRLRVGVQSAITAKTSVCAVRLAMKGAAQKEDLLGAMMVKIFPWVMVRRESRAVIATRWFACRTE